ncbi:MAG: type II secretion system protein GspC, partial [Polyangia bacterium]
VLRDTDPPGRSIDAAHAASVAKLGLVAKDTVRAVDGEPAVTLVMDRAAAHRPFVYLDVVRAGKPLAIRIVVRYPTKLSAGFYPDDIFQYRDLPAHVKVSAGAKPVALVTEEMGPLRAGDLITAVDGKQVDRKLLTDGLMPKKARTTVLTLVRGDTTIAMTLAVAPAGVLATLIATGIQKIDDTHYTIEKTAVDALLVSPITVAHGARFVPSMKDGKIDGLRLYAIRPQSVFASLGLMNGDTLNAINGLDLTSPDKALEAYSKIGSAKQLVIAITRRGKPLTLLYTIK